MNARLVAVGRWLLVGGVLLSAASLAVSVTGGKAGLILALLGLALCRDWPRGLAGVWWWGGLGAAWMMVSVALAAGAQGGPWFEKTGVMYTWLALPVAVAAVDCPLLAPGVARTWAWRLALAGALAAGLLGGLQFATGYAVERPLLHLSWDGVRHDRISGFFRHHYPYAMVLALIALAGSGLGAGRRARLLAWAAALAGGLLSVSRSVLVALPAALAAGRLARGTGRWLRFAALAAALALLGLLLLWLVSPAFAQETLHLRSGRYYIWDLARQVVTAHPLAGAGGQARFQAACLALLPERPADLVPAWWFPQGPPHAHNVLLTLAGWYGLPALVAHLGLLAASLRALLRRTGRSPAFAAGCALAGMVAAAGLLDFTIGDAETAAAWFTLTGLLCDARHPADPRA